MEPTTATVIDGLNLFGMLGTVLWHAIRIGAAMQAMPMLGGRSMPMRARLIFTLAISGALSALLPTPPAAGVDAMTVLTVLREFAVGIAIGTILRLAFEAGQFAGELVSQGMGLSFATMADPLSGASSPVLAQWFYLVFGLLFFTFDGHLALVKLLLDSYRALPLGTPLVDVQQFLSVVPTFFSTALQAGLLLALPVIVALLAVNLAFGVLARAAPQLNPVQLGLPVALLVGLVLLMLLARELQGPVERLFDQAFDAARALTA
jgi:flagellar biosynthetic protein FliR